MTRPNIVIIYFDDLGYGDIGAYGGTGVPTPNIDALAASGLRFTQGYATSATCTPSRYALLTGEYPWRNPDAQILPATAPLIIDPDRPTLPKMLRAAGYRTGIVGKWHLGLGDGDLDWNGDIVPGPNEVGFDDSYILAATQDRVPCVYIHNGRVVGLDPADPIEVNYEVNFPDQPTGRDHPELLRLQPSHGHDYSIVNGISRIGYVRGGASAEWVDEQMADHFLALAQEFVRGHAPAARADDGQPFFLYYALHQPHVPRTPHPRFAGTTGLGARGDVIAEADWCIGQFLDTVREEALLDDTLIILSSDNGPVLDDGYIDQAEELTGDHRPAGPLRGGKYSLFDGGTRVPFIVSWPGRVTAGVSDALVCQLDLMASLAALVDQPIATTDSQNLLGTLLGDDDQGRESLVIEAQTKTAFRQGRWVLIPPHEGVAVTAFTHIETGNAAEFQLYDLDDDLGQARNLAASQPEKLADLMAAYAAIRGPAPETV